MTENNEYKSGFVAVVGKPNVGKSTLINALMGQKIAAVSPRPQTTRRQQLGILSSDTHQIVFTDTPGIHQAKHKLGNHMNGEAQQALEESDVVLWLVDVSTAPDAEDLMISELLAGVSTKVPIVLGLNKTDLIEGGDLAKLSEAYKNLIARAEAIELSAKRAKGLDELLAFLLANLPEHPPFYDPEQVTDFYEREIASDLIREAALLILHDEVPHGIAVRMDEYTERDDVGAYIEATLFVERESQKGIVVGKGGEMIKRISTHARREIERMSGRKVFLRMRVKVRKNWRDDDNQLRLFGFQSKK